MQDETENLFCIVMANNNMNNDSGVAWAYNGQKYIITIDYAIKRGNQLITVVKYLTPYKFPSYIDTTRK